MYRKLHFWMPGHAYEAIQSLRGLYCPLKVASYHDFDLGLWLFVLNKGIGLSNPGSASQLSWRADAVYDSLLWYTTSQYSIVHYTILQGPGEH